MKIQEPMIELGVVSILLMGFLTAGIESILQVGLDKSLQLAFVIFSTIIFAKFFFTEN